MTVYYLIRDLIDVVLSMKKKRVQRSNSIMKMCAELTWWGEILHPIQ